MLRATLKSIRGHSTRLIGTAVAVVLGIAFLTGTLVFTDTVSRTFNDLFSSVYDGTDAEVRSAQSIDTGFGTVRGRIPEDLVTRVAAVDGVVAVDGFVQGSVRIVSPDGEPLGNPGQGLPSFGMSWTSEAALSPWDLVAGRGPESPDEVAIDRGSARAGDVEVGDVVAILASGPPEEFTVSGIVAFGTADSPAGATVALFELATAQRLFGAVGEVDAISAAGTGGVSQQELADRIAAAIDRPETVEVVTGEAGAEETQDTIAANLGFFNTFLTTFALIALFVSCFVIYNTFAILVAQRTRELALFRALGASRGQVVASVLIEAAVVGLFASAVGLVAGVGLSIVLREGLALLGLDIPAGGLVILGRTIVIGLVVGVVVTVASALLPAVGASRIAPLQAIRDLSVDRSARSGRRLVIGAIVAVVGAAALLAGLLQPEIALVGVGAALLFVGVFILGPLLAAPVARLLGAPLARFRGVTGRLARENATRNPTRTARTAAALMIGVALVAGVTVLAASLRASIRDIIAAQFVGDLVVDSGSFGDGGLSPELTAELNGLPEVATATGIRIALAEVEGEGTFVTAVDPATAFGLFDVGIVAGEADDLTDSSIFLLQSRAESLGVGLGDTVEARFLDGSTRSLTVTGLYTEPQLAGNQVISHALAEQVSPQQFDLTTFVRLADGVSIEQARPAIEAVTDRYPNATLQDRDQYVEAQAATIDILLNLIYGLLGLAVIIAAFGITNTLRLSVIERTREIGLLRAVGMTRPQIRSSIRWEAVITALLGAVQGVVIGLALGYAVIFALRNEGIATFSVPSGSLIVIVLLAAAIGVLAAIRPARRAARLDVLESIATE
jgi:putative ABC transport system permease protein